MSPSHSDSSNPTAEQERLLWQSRYSVRSVLGATLGGALVTTLLIVAVLKIPPLRQYPTVWATTLALIGLIWIGILIWTIYRKLACSYRLTTQRVIRRSGLIRVRENPVELLDLENVTYRQGFLGALTNVGNIHLKFTDAAKPNMTMSGIARVSQVAELIDRWRTTVRKQQDRSLGS